MDDKVATDKIRTSTYLSQEDFNEVQKQSEEAGISMSRWIRDAIDLRIDPDTIVLKSDETDERFKEIRKQSKEAGISISRWIQDAITLRLDPQTIVMHLDEQTYKNLKELADKEFRSVEDQFRYLLAQYLQT